VVVGVHEDREGLLVLAVDAEGLASFFLGSGEARQEEGGEDGYDGDDDQEFYEGKRSAGLGRTGLLALQAGQLHGLLCASRREKANRELARKNAESAKRARRPGITFGPNLKPGGFSRLDPVMPDAGGFWQNEDTNAVGWSNRFYGVSYP
jgi:hypothetical protein